MVASPAKRAIANSRRDITLNLLSANPAMPYSEIGKQLGITKEGVRQILKREGRFVKRHGFIVTKACPVCGKTITGFKSQVRKTCSKECSRFRPETGKRVTLVCCICGKAFTRKLCEARAVKHYCSWACYRGRKQKGA